MVATLSQVQAWSTEHLIETATYWTKTADQWEDVFLQMRNQSHTLVWDGAGGDALRARTGADFAIVSARADQLRQASQIARAGAGTIGTAQRRILYAGEDANNAGFAVGEDFSVTDTRANRSVGEQAARQAQAQAFADDICQRVTHLFGVEHDVAAKITAATAGLTPTFPETPHNKPHIQGGSMGGGPLPPESIPHPVQPPHSHHELPKAMEVVHARCAGLDISKKDAKVCVRVAGSWPCVSIWSPSGSRVRCWRPLGITGSRSTTCWRTRDSRCCWSMRGMSRTSRDAKPTLPGWRNWVPMVWCGARLCRPSRSGSFVT